MCEGQHATWPCGALSVRAGDCCLGLVLPGKVGAARFYTGQTNKKRFMGCWCCPNWQKKNPLKITFDKIQK